MLNRDLSAYHHEHFRNTSPFPHVILDSFLEPSFAANVSSEIECLVGNGPPDSTSGWLARVHNSGYAGSNKYELKPTRACGPAAELISYLNSSTFLALLEAMTGMEDLTPDPTFEGAGIHSSGEGGRLGLHTDFLNHPSLPLRRRLNLLLYLTQDWSPSWGGVLELRREPKEDGVMIEPKFNRALIFETSETSWHGHPKPLTPDAGRRRNSIALYYYQPTGMLTSSRNKFETTKYSFSTASTLGDRLTAMKFAGFNMFQRARSKMRGD